MGKNLKIQNNFTAVFIKKKNMKVSMFIFTCLAVFLFSPSIADDSSKKIQQCGYELSKTIHRICTVRFHHYFQNIGKLVLDNKRSIYILTNK